MAIHLVEIFDKITHSCPADAEPHLVSYRQRVVTTTSTGECRKLVTIRVGTTSAHVDCGRHEPADKQCAACRTHVIYEHALRPVA
jgi:hypothetical protein